MYDAAVIGGGSAGLTAALYLARFHLSVFLLDAGGSRAAIIPRTHNQPFWPEGISGADLLHRMRSHLPNYPIDIGRSEVEEIRLAHGGFELVVGGGSRSTPKQLFSPRAWSTAGPECRNRTMPQTFTMVF